MRVSLLIIALIFLGPLFINAQSNHEQLSNHIAQKMKDSLNLTNQQRDSIYAVNIQLSEWKISVRQQYTNPDSLRRHMQIVENRRDSLYRPFLSEEKYQLYLQKKRNLISNN